MTAVISGASAGRGSAIDDPRRARRRGVGTGRATEHGAAIADDGVRFCVSEDGQRSAQFDRIILDAAGDDQSPSDAVALPELIEFHRCMARAQKQLRLEMARVGIGPGEEIIIDTVDGGFQVVTAHPGASALQAAIDADAELQAALVGAYSTAHITRIGTAVGMAMRATRANPGNEETYFEWATAIARRALKMDVRFTLTGGVLSAMLIGDQTYTAARIPA